MCKLVLQFLLGFCHLKKLVIDEGFFFFFFLVFLGLYPVAYGGSQARSQMGAAAAGLHHSHSHSNAGSELHLRLTL